MFTLRQLKEFDTINIIETEEILNNFRSIDIQPENVIFFLDKGVVKCKIPAIEYDSDIVEYYYFQKVKDNVWVLDIYSLHNYEFSRKCMMAIDFNMKQKHCSFSFEIAFDNDSTRSNYNKNKEYYNQVFYSYAMVFYGVFAHFTKLIEQKDTKMRKLRLKKILSRDSSKKSTVESTNKKHRVKLTNSTGGEYELEINNSVYIKLQQSKRQAYERHMEAWTVRGHVRRYKNGKIIFIKPYTKGKGEVIGKEYILTEE